MIMDNLAKLQADHARAKKAVASADTALKAATTREEKSRKALAQALCPFRPKQAIAIGTETIFIVHSISLEVAFGNANPRWACEGEKVEFKANQPKASSERHYLTQKHYEKLPQKVRDLSANDIKKEYAQRREAYLARAGSSAMKLGKAQAAMLRHLINRDGQWPILEFLPRGIVWSNQSDTQRIWQSLADKQIFTIKPGPSKDTTHYTNWRVVPGPRLEEACAVANIELDKKSLKRARERANVGQI